MKSAVFAGSFDPLTMGHLPIIEAGAKLFDKLHVIVAANPDKKSGRFTLAERLDMATAAVRHLPNVEVVNVFGRYIVEWAKRHDCGWMVRGLRGPADLDQERIIEKVNATIVPGIQTLYIPAPHAVENVSSSLVMGLVGHAGWFDVVRPLVPAPVFRGIVYKHLEGVFRQVIADAPSTYQWLAGCYREERRKYHSIEHIAEVLDVLELYTPNIPNRDEVIAAIFFHDVVNGKGSEDEFESAASAFHTLTRIANRPGFSVDLVVDLVKATAKCGANPEFDRRAGTAKYLVDADMAVLGRDPDRYDVYAKQIREEYAQYDDAAYAYGRGEFLRGMLGRDRIFKSDEFHAALDAKARENMRRELARLT